MNNNPIHNRKRLARRIWKKLVAGYFSFVSISYGEGKDYRRINISKKTKGYFCSMWDVEKVISTTLTSNPYEILINEIRKADDIKCFGNKFVTQEWDALCFTKAYSYRKLAFCPNGGCHVIS